MIALIGLLWVAFIFAVLWLIFRTPRKTGRGRFEYSIGPVENKCREQARSDKGGSMPLEIKLTNEQKVHVGVKPVTATGKPAELDGAIVPTIISGEGTVEVDADGRGFTFTTADTPGDAQVLVEADADLGEGVVPISDVVKVTVEGAKAASLGLVADAPEPK